MPVIRIGLDVAKNVFQAHGVDEQGQVVLRKRLRRGEVLTFFASLPPCLISIEACSASHYWARELPIQAGVAVVRPGAKAPSYRVVPPHWSSPLPNAGSWWDILPPDVRFAGSALQ